MKTFRHWSLLALLATLCNATTSLAETPTAYGPAQAQAVIAELDLRAAEKPISAHPDWKPQRVAVLLLDKPGISLDDVELAMNEAAGEVELVFIRSGGKKLNKKQLEGVDGVIGMCNPALLSNADTTLRWVHSYTVGMDYCKGYTDAQLQEIVFTNNKRLSGPAIAEHAMAMLLALSHNLPAYIQSQQTGKWQRSHAANVTFGELKGKTMLVVGLGGIGTEIAWRAHGLGMRVIATRSSSRNGPDFVEYVGLSDELNTLAGKADAVVNALPLTPQTKGIFDKAFFNATKPGAIFLSVGRGKSTVTSALVSALESGQLYGAGLDVTDPEPLPKSSPLWKMPNVIITPHVSAAGPDSPQRSAIIAVENLRRYVTGEPMLNVVDLRKGY